MCPPDQARHLPKIRSTLDRRWDDVDPGLREAFGALCTGRAPWPLFLYGQVGAGKTLGALALTDRVTRGACYILAEDLAGLGYRPEDYFWHDTVKTSPLLVVDEIGARVKIGDLHYSTLKKTLDLREQYAGRVGVYISNCEPGRIATLYDERIASRLLCGTHFELAGPDRRMSA